ncbi:MAG: ribonuclease P protein subunit [Candidatus Heimdallarchaeota archaeon]|nr:ribonuclease P protein subunit [Candidatus Heimdallarchaeota archaeon]MCK5048156.1 ribonuclease P protein subunit [Candidatus Heimdallarchaeota archaeon]
MIPSSATREYLANEILTGVTGMNVSVKESAHYPYIGVGGIVIRETANTLHILNNETKTIVPKVGQEFKVTIGDWVVIIDGKRIQGTPAARMKKGIRRWR